MNHKKRILLKLSGTIFQKKSGKYDEHLWVNHIVEQIKELNNEFQFGIVIGGGNFFRGSQHGRSIGTRPMANHYVGMIATIMNGLLLQDLLSQQNLNADLLSTFICPEFAKPISPQIITKSFNENDIVIFSGGTGNPFFTTDTNAIVRALEIQTTQVWKATDVNGVYDDDPNINQHAKLISKTSYKKAQKDNLKIMDKTAFTLAEEHNITIRIFNIFKENALLNAAKDIFFGSTISVN